MRTAKRSKALPSQLAPRLLDADAAAAYLSLPVSRFKATVIVRPLLINNQTLYDLDDLNAWIDQQKGVSQTREQILAKLD